MGKIKVELTKDEWEMVINNIEYAGSQSNTKKEEWENDEQLVKLRNN